MEMSPSIIKLSKALVMAQAEFSAVPKESENPFFKSKYAALPDVIKHTSPVLSKHGLAVSQFISNDGNGNDSLTTVLIHESGEYMLHSMLLHLVKDDPQSQGSAVTYARRYAYMACLGVVSDEDDDGNAASKPRPKVAPAEVDVKSLPEDLRNILSAASASPENEFLNSLARQYYERGSLSEKQIAAGSRQAIKVLVGKRDPIESVDNSFFELKPGEEPFE